MTIVVNFVLVPAKRKAGSDLSNLFSLEHIIMHNANVALMVGEVHPSASAAHLQTA